MGFHEYFAIFLILVLILSGLAAQKSKALFYIDIIVLILLLGFYDSLQSDLYFYTAEYEGEYLAPSIFEKGYEFLGILFHRLGFSFGQFHLLITVLSVWMIAYVIKKLSPRPAFCMSLMFGFPTMTYAFQLKSMVSSAVIAFAVFVFFKDVSSKKNRVLFVILILTASQFHFFALIFLLMLLVSVRDTKKLIWLSITAAVAGTVFVIPVTNIARRFIPALQTYGVILSMKTIVLSMAWHTSGTVLMKYIRDAAVVRKSRMFSGAGSKEAELINNIYKGSIIFLMMLPFYCYTNVMARYIRAWSPFYFIAISFIRTNRFRINRSIFLKIIMIAYMCFSFFAFYVFFGRDKQLVHHVLDGNFMIRSMLGL